MFSQGTLVKQYTIEEGLPENSIRAIYKDSRGYLWIGTDAGLARFNGKEFMTYNSIDGLLGDSAWDITEDSIGRIWVACYGSGISVFDGKTFQNISKKEGLNNVGIRTLSYSPITNTVLAGCDDGIIHIEADLSFKELSSTTLNIDKRILVGAVYQYCEDTAVISTMHKETYLYYTKEHTLIPITNTKHKYAEAFGHSGMVDEEGNYTISFNSLKTFYKDSIGLMKFSDFNLNGPAWSIAKDDDGNFWAATWGGGVTNKYGSLIFCDSYECDDYAAKLGIKSFVFWSLYFDKENNQLFIGTLDQGLFVLNYSPFSNKEIFKNYTEESFAYLPTKDGENLFVSDATIFKFHNDTVSSNLYEPCLKDQLNAWAIKLNKERLAAKTDPLGNYDKYQKLIEQHLFNSKNPYLSDFNEKLEDGSYYDSNYTKEDNKTKPIKINSSIIDVFEYDGDIWYSTNSILVRKKGPCEFKFYNISGGKVYLDSQNRLWLLRQYSSIMLIEDLNHPLNFLLFNHNKIKAPTDVTGIVENSNKHMVFASNSRGLFYYRDGLDFHNYTNEESFLTSNKVRLIKEMNTDTCAIALSNGDLFICSFNDTIKVIKKINANIGLSGRSIYDLLLKGNKLFIWSEKGIEFTNYYDLINDKHVTFSLINKKEGLPILSGSLVNNNDISWYQHKNGLLEIDWSAFEKFSTVETRLFIREIKVHYQSIDWGERADIGSWESVPERMFFDYNENSLQIFFDVVNLKNFGKDLFRYKLEGFSKNWSNWELSNKAEFAGLPPGDYTFIVQSKNQLNPTIQNETQISFSIYPPWWQTWWAYTLYFIFIFLSISFFIKWRTKKLKQRQEELEHEVQRATQEIRNQKNEIEAAHIEITDSINYAERIQRSFLATKVLLDENLDDYFVYFNPKEAVSGDFYWAAKLANGNFSICCADSTGHGVPGAIMSILNISSMEKSIEKGLTNPAAIFNETRTLIIDRLKKDGSKEGGSDGMDACLISLKPDKSQMEYVAANNPIWIIRDGELIPLKPEKMPVGKYTNDNVPFIGGSFELKKGDVIYAISDGFQDQFGGIKGKKYKIKTLKELLLSIQHLPLKEQEHKLHEEFESWKGNEEQVDDVCVIGVRV